MSGVVSSDTLQLSHVKEAVSGVTPQNPHFEVWRTTGESLVFTPQTSESAELGGSGRSQQPANVTGMTVGGDINFELSKFTALEEAIASVLAATWGECPLTGNPGGGIDSQNRITIGNELQTFTIEKRFPNPTFVQGNMPITVSPTTPAPAPSVTFTFAGAASVGSGLVVINLAEDNGVVHHYSIQIDPNDDAAAVAASAITVINAGHVFTATAGGAAGEVDVAKSIAATSITTATARAGADRYLYQRYRGVSYSAMSFSTSPNNPVTGSVTTVGGVPELDYLPLPGAVYTPAGNSAVFTAPEVMALTVGSVLNIGTKCWTNLEINFDSQNRGIACIGTQGDREVVLGTMAISISGDVYFSDQSILAALLANETLGDGVFTFSNADGDVYRFDMYGLKPVSGELAAGGQGQDLTIPVEFQPTPRVVCDDGAGNSWTAGAIISTENTAPAVP